MLSITEAAPLPAPDPMDRNWPLALHSPAGWWLLGGRACSEARVLQSGPGSGRSRSVVKYLMDTIRRGGPGVPRIQLGNSAQGAKKGREGGTSFTLRATCKRGHAEPPQGRPATYCPQAGRPRQALPMPTPHICANLLPGVPALGPVPVPRGPDFTKPPSQWYLGGVDLVARS